VPVAEAEAEEEEGIEGGNRKVTSQTCTQQHELETYKKWRAFATQIPSLSTLGIANPAPSILLFFFFSLSCFFYFPFYIV
jgi:hypothetical protein